MYMYAYPVCVHSAVGRRLERWEAPSDAGPALGLEEDDGARWDQFEANKRLFNVTTTFKEVRFTHRSAVGCIWEGSNLYDTLFVCARALLPPVCYSQTWYLVFLWGSL